MVMYNAEKDRSPADTRFASLLAATKADLVCIVDPPTGFLDREPTIRADYPYRVEPMPGLNWPIVLLSRHPFKDFGLEPYAESVKFSFPARRSVLVTLPGGAEVVFSAMYPRSPRKVAFWRQALESVETDAGVIGRWVRGRVSGDPALVVAGDFNSTPTGRVHRLMAKLSGLRAWSPLLGAGTWPAILPRTLSAPIDRVWVSEGARVVAGRAGPRLGSDHRPVVVDVEVQK